MFDGILMSGCLMVKWSLFRSVQLELGCNRESRVVEELKVQRGQSVELSHAERRA